MKYYTIQNNNILIADKEESLTSFYDNVLPLPEDYEEGKYIIGSMEKEIEVPDYETVIEEYQEPVYKSVEQLDEEGFPIGYIEEVDYYETKTKEKLVQVGSHIETVIVPCLVLNPNYEAEQETKRQQEIAMLSLTAADVERGIYKATGKDFDDIVALVTELQPQGIDIKALKIELKANNFYRGNAYVDAVGSLLGFTKEQLDLFFEDGNYEHLLVKTEEELPTNEIVLPDEPTEEISQ